MEKLNIKNDATDVDATNVLNGMDESCTDQDMHDVEKLSNINERNKRSGVTLEEEQKREDDSGSTKITLDNGIVDRSGNNANMATALIDLSCNNGEMPDNWHLRVDANPVELADAAMNNKYRDLRNRISSNYDADDNTNEIVNFNCDHNAMNSGSGAADPEYDSILNDLTVRIQNPDNVGTPETIHSCETTNDECFAELNEPIVNSSEIIPSGENSAISTIKPNQAENNEKTNTGSNCTATEATPSTSPDESGNEATASSMAITEMATEENLAQGLSNGGSVSIGTDNSNANSNDLQEDTLMFNMVLNEYYEAVSSSSIDLDSLFQSDQTNENEINPRLLNAQHVRQPNVEVQVSVLPSINNIGSDNNSSDSQPDDVHMADSGDIRPESNTASADQRAADAAAVTEILNKPKLDYNWNLAAQLRYRENGLTHNGRFSIQNGSKGDFQRRYYGSRQVVERLRLEKKLSDHDGCVNCLNFNRTGDLLCSGSDDLRIIVWNWSQKKIVHSFQSGHWQNIFQVKFVNNEGTDIVSSSYDCQIRRSLVATSGYTQTVALYRHRAPVHKIVVCPGTYHEIISVGEDSIVNCKDLRSSGSHKELVRVITEQTRYNEHVRLFSVSHNPVKPEICVSGSDSFVRVFDKRNFKNILHKMCPQHLLNADIPQVTCCVYNHDGSEVLASYGDECIYLFNNISYKTGEHTHRYRGHYNHRTIKGVNFFGPETEYVISGSDCGHIFIWDKETEAIVNYMEGDDFGPVNCLEPHPTMPILATSGLEHNARIWSPSYNTPPMNIVKLQKIVQRNMLSAQHDIGDLHDRLFHFIVRRFLYTPNMNVSQDEESESSTNSSDTTTSEEDSQPSEGFDCPTQ